MRCGHRDPTGKTLQIDHVLDKARYGPAFHLSDYQTLCALTRGGCHREKSAREAAERAAEKRSAVTKRKPKAVPVRSKRSRWVFDGVSVVFAVVAVMLGWRWAVQQDALPAGPYELWLHWLRIVGVAAAVTLVVAVVFTFTVTRRRLQRSDAADRLSQTLASTFGYSTGVSRATIYRLDRVGPVRFKIAYLPTTADEDPAWAPRMVAATSLKLGYAVRLVSLDVVRDEITMERCPSGTPLPPLTGAAVGGVDPHAAEIKRITDGAVSALGVKEKERPLLQVIVPEWNENGVWPARVIIRYPSSVSTQNWDVRSNLFDKLSDLYDEIRWGVVWRTANDTVEFKDLGPDPLASFVPLPEIPDAVPDAKALLSAIPMGVQEDGSPWTLNILGRHLLVAGASGAGKGSIFWNLIRGLLPLIESGHVVIAACDPKGGMELLTPGGNPGLGQPSLFEWAAVSNADIAALVERQEKDMKARAARMTTREHTPTPDSPYVIVLVDELLNPTVIEQDKKVRAQFESGMVGILSAGRAAGWSFVAATQRPDVDTLRFRDLFTMRVCLRVMEKTKVNMVLGEKAREHGARADLISKLHPGICYVAVDDPKATDNGSIVRVRAAYPDDTEIERMVKWITARDAAAEAARVAALPVAARDLRENARIVVDLGGMTPVSVVSVEADDDGRVAVDYVDDAGEPGSIEVDGGELFERG